MAVIFPWDKIYIYDIRLQEHQAQYDVLAKDGLTMRVSISIRWKPIEADLGKLHQDVGPEYLDTLIIPIVGAFAREEIGQFDAEDLYAEQRLLIQNNILTNVQQRMVHEFYPSSQRESLIRIENILIREIVLPVKVSEAIQDKVEQMHLADAYVYRLEREVQEAERKAIEARGIRRFQEEINGSITNEFLRWKGIDATLQLAKSNNAKVVVIGAGDEGLPIILGGLDSPAQTSGVAIERDAESESDISIEVGSESNAGTEIDQEFDSRAIP
jgi:regulator of protease activity HflC (stomatin/prohibitin superfamily)